MTLPNEMPVTFRAQLDAALARPVMLDPSAFASVRAAAGFASTNRVDGAAAPGIAEPLKFHMADGGVAIVDVVGPLAQHAWDCWMFSGDGYDAIAERVGAALTDPATTAVLMRFDSPGGEVAGCFESVLAIRAAAMAADKPIVAFADEKAASAAYALACACDAIVLPDSGIVGSIGVIAEFVDESRALDAAGIGVTILTSGARKADGHPALPMSDDARSAIQAKIDYLAQLFAAEVSRARGLTSAEVLALEAATFYGPAAVKAGLADRVGSMGDALALAREMAATRKQRRTMSARARALAVGRGMRADAVPFESHLVIEDAWDADAATQRLRAWAGVDAKNPPSSAWEKYRRGFAWYDAADAAMFGAYKLIHHDVRDGELVTSRRGTEAAAGALQGARGGVDIPDADRPGVRTHIEKHYHQWGGKAPWEPQGSSQGRKMSDALVTKLGLEQTASEADVLAACDALTAFRASTLAQLGVTDVAEAPGAMAALKLRAERGDAAVAEAATLRSTLEARDRADMIEQGRRDGKLSPAMVDKLVPELDTKALRAFLAHAPRVVPADNGLRPPAPTMPTRAWADMKPAERARLFQEDRASYDALKSAAEGR